MNVSIEPHGFNWRAEDFESFEFVSDYELTGLTNLNHSYGLGVPLIAVRKTGAASPRIERYYAPGLSFPITAFLRLQPDTDDQNCAVTLRLELYDPLESTTVRAAGRQVPLETDLSTPLAYFLDRPTFRHLDTYGLLRPDRAARIAGLYMIQPYQPGKIPVVMIHGLWSSPMTWIEALNDLQSVSEIRDNFQFWFYLYPTGEPFWKTAAKLRNDLDRVDEVFGASDHGPALRNKVLIGHSMGGLLARLMTLDSRNHFWDSVSKTPLADIDADRETKDELRQVFFFQPNRSVARVVTIASPFRGSEVSNNFTRWLGKQVITLPLRTMATTRQLLDRNPDTFRRRDFLDGTTSLDSLSPHSPFLQVMQTVRSPGDVPHHNIVGATYDVPLAENSDGIVAYRSAHLDDVASEIVVAAGHNDIQRHPRTILEIRRILLEHLADYNRSSAMGIVPVNAQTGLDNRRGHGGFGHSMMPSAAGHSPLWRQRGN